MDKIAVIGSSKAFKNFIDTVIHSDLEIFVNLNSIEKVHGYRFLEVIRLYDWHKLKDGYMISDIALKRKI